MTTAEPVTDNQLNLDVVDAIIAEQKQQHDAGTCISAECVWCDEPAEIETSMVAVGPKSMRGVPAASSTRAPSKQFNTGPRTKGYKQWLATKGRKKKQRRKRHWR